MHSEKEFKESPLKKSVTLVRKQSDSIPDEQKDIRLITETAATLCHEINNPLMAITANIEIILKGDNQLSEEVRKKLRLIDKAAKRIKVATEKLTRLDSLNYKNTIAGRMINIREVQKNRLPELIEAAE